MTSISPLPPTTNHPPAFALQTANSSPQAPFVLTQTASPTSQGSPQQDELRKAFDSFVGETFFGQMLSAMRKTVDKPAYFHGGRAEEVFQSQLDQVLSEKLTESSASNFTGPMFDLFTMNRR